MARLTVGEEVEIDMHDERWGTPSGFTYDFSVTTGSYNDGAPVGVERIEHSGGLVCDAWTYDIHETYGDDEGRQYLTTRTYYGYTPNEAREMFRFYCAQNNLKIVG